MNNHSSVQSKLLDRRCRMYLLGFQDVLSMAIPSSEMNEVSHIDSHGWCFRKSS